MFLGAYHFDGDPVVLTTAYNRLMKMMPPDQIDLHVCVTRKDGMTIYDACPDRDVFVAFSSSADLAGAFEGAGLPQPRVEPLGEVHFAKLRQPVGI